MAWRERDPLSELARSELAVVDAALRGDALPAEHAELAELALLLREDRPRPQARFAGALDREVDRRVHREPVRSAPRVDGPARWRRWLAEPVPRAAGAVVLTALIAVGAFALIGGERHRGGAQSARHEAFAHGGSPAQPVGEASEARAGTHLSASKGVAREFAQPSVASPAAAPAGRSVEQTATLQLGVSRKQIASTGQQVFTIVNSFHGYVQQSSTTSGSAQEGGASFQLRVPSSSISGTLAALSQLGRVLSETNTTSDVTEQLSSLQRSLGSARAERAALIAQIAHTSERSSVEALRGRLRGVDARIAGLQTSLRSLSSQVATTPISLTLTGEAPAQASSSGDLTPGGAVRDAGEILSTALAVLLIALAATLPVALALALAWSAITTARRRQREQTLDLEA
ncbi:MAG TPA: DUF4349 domain-containing protein [Solirubrobacteraceae bacterium]|nr:DUF4349 domain-containing protein [Solirubrobacteraceae bacterium]